MTKEEAKAQLSAVFAISECIRELGEVPSGHLYANLMDKMSIEFYTGVVEMLKKTKLVEERAHVLRWIGPRKGEKGSGEEASKVA